MNPFSESFIGYRLFCKEICISFQLTSIFRSPSSVSSSQQQYQVDPFAYNANAVPGASPTPMGTALTAPAQPNAFDEFAPQAPSYNDISSQILMGYSPHAPVAANPSSGLDKSTASSTVASSNPFDDPVSSLVQ